MPVVKVSRYAYSETLARLRKSVTDAGNTVFATIDQAAAAKQSGLTMRPTTLIVFGNPKAGTPLMDAFPLAALDLPLKLVVWEQDATVSVAYVTGSELAARYGITGKDALIAAIDNALSALGDSIA
jgi:uncharacterized protein (DUF302 family)